MLPVDQGLAFPGFPGLKEQRVAVSPSVSRSKENIPLNEKPPFSPRGGWAMIMTQFGASSPWPPRVPAPPASWPV
ncbi:MAG: hypothetical protein M0C28_01345 [Candidatus Moduliflexus flocculans]|nr:hypothetical protein [Candidatus Moduliflexus flocculans]